jgi:hypothetical protein
VASGFYICAQSDNLGCDITLPSVYRNLLCLARKWGPPFWGEGGVVSEVVPNCGVTCKKAAFYIDGVMRSEVSL